MEYLVQQSDGTILKIVCEPEQVNSLEYASEQDCHVPADASPTAIEYAPEQDDSHPSVCASQKAIWMDAQVKLLIELYKEFKPQLGRSIKLKTKQKMWQRIQEGMAEKGHNFTAIQIESKWKSLDRNFKNCANNNKLTGRQRMTCSYEKELMEVMKERPAVFPKYVLGARGEGQSKEPSNAHDGSSSSSECALDKNCELSVSGKEVRTISASPNCSKRKRSEVEIKLSELYDIKAQKMKKMEDLEIKKLNAYEERTKVLKERNSLLEKILKKLD